jgi:small GTP-binding protein
VIQKKVCLLGAYATGKTSLASRFVHGIFSDRYRTTVGVRIDRKDVVVGDQVLRMLVWDLHGEDEYQRVKGAYLRGAAGCLVVVDGTRRATLTTGLRLLEWARAITGPVPYALLLNKTDLDQDWEVDRDALREAVDLDCAVLETSALTGAGVRAAFRDLAVRMADATV